MRVRYMIVTKYQNKEKERKTLFIIIVGVLLLVFGVAGLFSLNGSGAKFDRAYDSGDDLGRYYFQTLEEGQSYTFLENAWLFSVRSRSFWMLVGMGLILFYFLINKHLLYSQGIAPYMFLLPFILTFSIFFLYPLITTIRMSFQSITATSSEWIGFTNYEKLFSNGTFYIAVNNSLRYTVITCALLIPFPLLFAYMLNAASMKASGLFKAILFVPVLSSVVVAGIIFRMMFSELDGAMMNQIRGLFGMEPIRWLKGEWTSMFAMVLLCCWRWTGMNILYYMAGLKSIPNSLYEAADIDGANAVQKFRRIAWPLLKPTTIYVLTISIYAGLAMFTESYMIFGNNTSPKNYGLTIVGYLYRYGFEKVDKFGFASAVGLVLLTGALLINLLQLRITGVIGRRKGD